MRAQRSDSVLCFRYAVIVAELLWVLGACFSGSQVTILTFFDSFFKDRISFIYYFVFAENTARTCSFLITTHSSCRTFSLSCWISPQSPMNVSSHTQSSYFRVQDTHRWTIWLFFILQVTKVSSTTLSWIPGLLVSLRLVFGRNRIWMRESATQWTKKQTFLTVTKQTNADWIIITDTVSLLFLDPRMEE